MLCCFTNVSAKGEWFEGGSSSSLKTRCCFSDVWDGTGVSCDKLAGWFSFFVGVSGTSDGFSSPGSLETGILVYQLTQFFEGS